MQHWHLPPPSLDDPVDALLADEACLLEPTARRAPWPTPTCSRLSLVVLMVLICSLAAVMAILMSHGGARQAFYQEDVSKIGLPVNGDMYFLANSTRAGLMSKPMIFRAEYA